MRLSIQLLSAFLLCAIGVPAFAQSPNTATVVVVVTDQTGAVVPDATVSFKNTTTGASREATSGSDGSATLTALAISGAYRVSVSKTGFTAEDVKDVILRGGETATLKVKLVATGGTSEVTVYGTTTGVRNDPELGQRLDSDRIDDVPILGRKISALPLENAAFRNAKGTGDLFMNSVYFVSGAGGRRQADFVIDGATADEPWGRQTMFATLPVGAVQEMNVQSRAFSPEFGWTSSAAVNIVTKSGGNLTHGDALFLGRPSSLQSNAFGTSGQCPSSIPTCTPPIVNGALTPITPPDVPDTLEQESFSLGGALVKDKAHYFVAADITNQDRTAAITSPLVVPTGSTFLPYQGHYQQALVDARIDDTLSSANSLMGRFNMDRFFDSNPQDTVGGNVLPSAARTFTRHSYTGQLNLNSIVSGSKFNEARVEFLDADPVTQFQPVTPSTQFTRAGAAPFTSGTSLAVTVFSRETEFSDTLSLTKGRSNIRIGGNAAYETSGGNGTEFGNAYTMGQFTVNTATTAPLASLQLSDMTKYQQSFNFGQGTYTLNQWVYALFAQDSYRIGSDVTLDLGVRYDRQTFSDGKKNLAPRVGFAWNPGGHSDTAIRGGYGIYYTELRANNDPSFTLGGPQGQFTYTASPGQTGFPTCLTCVPVVYNQNTALSTLPARNITIRPGMASYYAQFFNIAALPGYASATFVNPKSQVASIGIEHQMGKRATVAVDYVCQHWTNLDQTVDLNAPSLFVRTTDATVNGVTCVADSPGCPIRSVAAADATRPIVPVNGGYRQINVIESIGVADYNGLQTSFTWRNAGTFFQASYTLSKSTDTTEPDGNGAGQNDFNQLGSQEVGPSLLDQRHRMVLTLTQRLAWDITAGTVSHLASGKPINPTTGTDNNGDGNTNDRPVVNGVVVGRYSFRGDPIYDTSVFAEKRIAIGGGRNLLLRIEGFNVFNRANVLARNSTYGQGATPLATFGQATPGLASIDPPRMFQLQARFTF